MNYQTLDWDTNFFGFNVASLDPCIDINELNPLLSELENTGVQLVYWQSEKKLTGRNMIHNYLLADRKVTFHSLVHEPDKITLPKDYTIRPFSSNTPTEKIIDLAIQSGHLSRFAKDPNIPKERFEALYSEWIIKSLSKELADEVFILSHHKTPVGFVSVKKENNKGEIGLIAVDAKHRGRKLGNALMNKAQQWFHINDITDSYVVTQEINDSACRLYQKNHYNLLSKVYFYHFWLHPKLK